ncbi:MAG: cytochrome c3 family protein [Proteobacteria bacterium]|nr:cytochrome c3 family protein [Pseudomonadota bacterium]MBU1738244.1 cytochrome c3 family protein [Pseudomonadota bacterium]
MKLILALVVLPVFCAATASAGQISVLAPAETDLVLNSRNTILNVVVRVDDQNDLARLSLKEEKSGQGYEPAGRYERENRYYVHYRVPLKKGSNTFTLAPTGNKLKIRFNPLSSLLNVDFNAPKSYSFHKTETIPAECGGCHTDKLPGEARIDKVLYGRFSPACYSCHSAMVSGREWRHFPSSALLCRSCHQPDPEKDLLTVPAGKIEELCFQCHVNERKWRNKDSHIHGPVGTGDCTICHDPHGSANRYQLPAAGEKQLCVICHVDKKKYLDPGQQNFAVHGILNAKGCTICHSPHATQFRFQLTHEINDLCVSCHTNLEGVEDGHPVQNHPVKGKSDPRRKGFPFTCTSCHNPHGSRYQYLLIGDVRGGNICVKCHSAKQEAGRN